MPLKPLWARTVLSIQKRIAALVQRPPEPVSDNVFHEPYSPFYHYNTVIDVEALIKSYAMSNLKPNPCYITNFLGVLIDPKFFPQLLEGKEGEVEGLPIPGNWHADMAEFAVALRAVSLAQKSFTIIELGCGWGCWLNNTGAAARKRGLAVNLIGVEGDGGHIQFAKEACATNGFSDNEITLHHGIAAVESGVALFPRQDHAGLSWGLQPIFGATKEQRREAIRSGGYDELPTVALMEIAKNYERIDCLHIDIQGGETELIKGCLDFIGEKVSYIFIGTHSRQIEGALFNMLLNAGWKLEIERPCFLKLDGPRPYTWVDGVQGWRNASLLAL